MHCAYWHAVLAVSQPSDVDMVSDVVLDDSRDEDFVGGEESECEEVADSKSKSKKKKKKMMSKKRCKGKQVRWMDKFRP